MTKLKCWCGNDTLSSFSDTFQVCTACSTLVSANDFSQEYFSLNVTSKEHGIYGKDYWFGFQDNLNQPHITERARTDLPARCMNWLTALLKYKTPGGKAIEMGCAHGGFVYLMRLAGFDASGMELSPAIIEFAEKTFQIPMLQGIIEEQDMAPENMEVIAAMDVLEHLPDPVRTLQKCADVLKPDGVFLFQTPIFHDHYVYQDLVKKKHSFVYALKSIDHTYIFSEASITKILRQVGFKDIRFEPSFFWPMNMLVAASKSELVPITQDDIAASLLKTVEGRTLLAMLDLEQKYQDLNYISKMNIKYKKWVFAIKDFKNKLILPSHQKP
jgi:2-polyprenyl-3-methyl-5-hydroxy-6-metoxy-1,4-benzoquinol methylase